MKTILSVLLITTSLQVMALAPQESICARLKTESCEKFGFHVDENVELTDNQIIQIRSSLKLGQNEDILRIDKRDNESSITVMTGYKSEKKNIYDFGRAISLKFENNIIIIIRELMWEN